MSELLTADDLQRWLGYDQDARVCKWLKQRGIKFDLGKDGRPVTIMSALLPHFVSSHQSDDFDFADGPQKKAN